MARAALPAAVLWDLDGTLVDTEPLWREEEADLVAQHGGTWTPEDGLALVGTALPAYARALQGAGVRLSEDEIITWITSDGTERSREELAARVREELGMTRRSSRVDAVVAAAVRRATH